MDLDRIKGLVAPDMRRVEESIAAAISCESPPVRELLGYISHYSGKRLRPALILLVARALGSCSEDHIKLGAVIELIHTATLVHDDILDGASMRRRRQSVNAAHGDHVSVLLGDMVYARAFRLSLTLSTPEAAQHLAAVTATICQGEIEQIAHRNNFELAESAYYSIIGAKTASLYDASCRLAAHYAGASQQLQDGLGRYGRDLGMAFQIVDDCLDIVGEETVVGKSLGTDTERGKMTLPLIHLAAGLEDAERARLKEIFLSADVRRKNQAIAEAFDLQASIDHAFGEADRLIHSALRGLALLPSSPYKDALVSAAEFVLIRKV